MNIAQENRYPFYLSKCNLFIDNYHLKIMKIAQPISYKFHTLGNGNLVSFAEWLTRNNEGYLITFTDRGYVIIINIK
jgi:hypothetical protein